MIEINEKDLQAAILATEHLLTALKRIANPSESEAEDTPAVKAKLARRECLACGVVVPEGDFYTRGLHKACYNTTMRRFRERKWSEDERVAQGKLSVRGTPGRPAAIDIASQAYLESVKDQLPPQQKAAETKEKYKRKKS